MKMTCGEMFMTAPLLKPINWTQQVPPPIQHLTVAAHDTNNKLLSGRADQTASPHKDSNRYAFGDRLFVTTNMLYDAALTPNIGAGLCVTDRITILADWMYARWSNRDKRRYWRIYGGDLEARYHIGRQKTSSPLAGHHVGVYCSMACYDFQAGRSHKGVLSDKWNYAAGMSYTYSMPIATHFNIDFSIGVDLPVRAPIALPFRQVVGHCSSC